MDLGSVDLTLDPAPCGRSRVVRAACVPRLLRVGADSNSTRSLAVGGVDGVRPAEPDDVFTADPDGLWRAVLRRQGGRLAWLADAPDDLSTN